MELKVVICGRSRLGREAMARRLEHMGREIRIVGESTTVSGAAILARRNAPHLVVLLDATTADVEQVRKSCTRPPEVVVVNDDELTIESGLRATQLPRNRYTPRAMTAALERVTARL